MLIKIKKPFVSALCLILILFCVLYLLKLYENEHLSEQNETILQKHLDENATYFWIDRIVSCKVFRIENKNEVICINGNKNQDDFMKAIGLIPGSHIEINNIVFKGLKDDQLQVFEILKKTPREIDTDFDIQISDYWKNNHDGEELDDLYSDFPPIPPSSPSEYVELPYNSRYFVKDTVNTSKYFIPTQPTININIIPENTGFENHVIEVSIYSFDTNEKVGEIFLDITEFAVYRLFFTLDLDKDSNNKYYVQIVNKSDIDSVNGSYSIQNLHSEI